MNDSDDEYIQPLVIDNGSGTIKAGFSGAVVPRVVFPSIVGLTGNSNNLFVKSSFVGDEVFSNKSIRQIKFPLQNGIITNWDDMQKIWHYTFYNQLRVAPEEHPILFSECSLNPKANREKLIEIMFETFNIPAIYICNQAVLGLITSGLRSGVVVESGDSGTQIVPVYEGNVCTNAIQRINIGGRHLTSFLQRILNGKGYSEEIQAIQIYQDIKEKFSYVSKDFKTEISKDSFDIKNLKLADGQNVCLGKERFQVPEALFRPSMIDDNNSPGIHTAILQSIKKTDIEIRKTFYSSIVLSGGNTLFPGFSDRLRSELISLEPAAHKVQITAPRERKYSVWRGGSLLSSHESFQNKWVTFENYEESGVTCIGKSFYNYYPF